MLIRDAVQLVRSATLSASRKVGLVCSFEPLHLHTYVQALLAQRLSADTPAVITFGYDQLRSAFAATSSSLRSAPVLFCLSWSDLHPALSWRTRSHGLLHREGLTAEAARLNAAATEWLAARHGADTFVLAPPLDFLPLPDACSPKALGEIATTASALMANLVADLSRGGARVLRGAPFDLNYRDLLLSGCPISAEHAASIARTFVDLAFPARARTKAVITDLDGTLWHGVIGEDGPTAIACAPDGKGHPFYVFQEFLLKLRREGVMLAFCSKNNPGDVLPVFDALGLPLKLADFSATRCNWQPKSAGIHSIARELNIAPDALIMIDDDAAEIAEIQCGLPGVEVWPTPRDAKQWRELFDNLQERCATWIVSDQDRGRSDAMTREHERRRAVREVGEPANGGSDLSYLDGLNLEVTIQEQAFSDPRSLELVNRTNQFNLTGERFAPDQWLDWAATAGAFCWSARLKDRFGDFGTICVITGRIDGPVAHVRQFVMSCRALARGVETIILGELCTRLGVRELHGPFVATGKNEPARRFLAGLGGKPDGAVGWQLSASTVLDARRIVVAQTHATYAPAVRRDLKTTA